MDEMNNKFSNKTIAGLLRKIETAYVIRGENYFKIAAYREASDTIGKLNREVRQMWSENKLTDIPGIGKSISAYLDEYFQKGKVAHFEEILKNIPPAVFELVKLSGLGPKRAYKLVQSLHLNDAKTAIRDLKKTAQENKIAAIPGFGEKSQSEIIESLEFYENKIVKKPRMVLTDAFAGAKEVGDYLKKNPLVKRVDMLGSLRRMTATVGDVDLAAIVEEKNMKPVIDYFVGYPHKIKIENAGREKASIIIPPSLRVDLRLQTKENYGSMLQYFTGSKSHNIKLREYALRKGFSLSEYGIKKVQNKNQETNLKFQKEKDFYNHLGLEYIPPEIREGTNEIELAEKKRLPDLVALKNIKGDLHLHSSYDLKPSHDLGANTYEEIMQKGKDRGYEYVGFADHNPKISNLSRLQTANILKMRKKFIERINKIEQIKYFIGLEVDILVSGELAFPKEAIDSVDYLIVSVHSSFEMNESEMTKRIIKGLEFPKVKILGHPTGRMIGKRESIDADWLKIFSICRQKNIALEINAFPLRLDLPDYLVKSAIDNGVKLIVDSDAHNISQMDGLFYGVSVARRGWSKKDDIINTLGYNDFREWLLVNSY